MKFGFCLIIMLALAKNIGLAAETSPPDATSAPAGTSGPTFDVRGYRIEGNTVLPPEKFLLLTNYTGHAVDLP